MEGKPMRRNKSKREIHIRIDPDIDFSIRFLEAGMQFLFTFNMLDLV